MSRIESRFTELRAAGRKALVTFVTAGDPAPERTVALMHALVRGGADIIELGIPFSDPMADGPVIQRASERALSHGVSVYHVLGNVAEFRARDRDTPIVFMGYLNPYEAIGYQRFADEAAKAGVDGAITVDLPPEEAEEFTAALKGQALDPIFLIAPTTTEERLEAISAHGRGFMYYVSFKGVTGASKLDVAAVKAKLDTVRKHSTLPIAVGFGIKDAQSARQVARIADGVVVGTALVAKIESLADEPDRLAFELETFTATLRAGVDAVRPTSGNDAR